jgi:hypothetical protein
MVVSFAAKNEWDDFAHGLVGNLSGVEPQLTPCARREYDADEWPVISVNSVFPGVAGYADRRGKIRLVSRSKNE